MENESTIELEKQHPKASWSRFIYMILFFFISRLVSVIVFFIAAIQFIYLWINDKPNQNLLAFSQTLSSYAKEIIQYLTFNHDNKPWPLGEYPRE